MLRFSKNFLLFFLFAFLAQSGIAQNWQIVWQDEFNYSGLPDASKWGYDVGAGGWGNGEAQYYSNARLENTRVENGNLIIEARRDWSGAEYSSARLVSRGKGDWTYGRIEVRAKIPVGQGLWPAIWMLPTDWAYGGWPASGEIDIMESFALGGLKYDKVEANIHTQAYNHTIGTNKGAPITGLSNIQDNYHTYGVTWDANKMVFDVDGRQYFTFNNEGTWQKWPYDKRFHLIMNIAVGGSLGTWIDPNIFPKRMTVDYVRVYQDNGVPPINPTTGLVTAYRDCNYAGFSGGFDVGDYNLAAMKTKGINDNDISSLRVTRGFKAILFENDNFSGASTTITSDLGCSADWNDRVSSLRVVPNGITNLAGIYCLQNRHSNLNLDVRGGTGALNDGARMQQWNVTGTTNQQFRFEHVGDGAYKVTAVHSGKALDIDGIKKENGAFAQQWGYAGSFNQQWIVVATDVAGTYKLIAKHSGRILEVAGASTALEAQVQQWDDNNQTCGQWKFVPPISPTTGLVTTYDNCDYTGFSGGLEIGDYNMARLKSLGINDDAISSLRITQGYQAILFQDDNFTGGSTVINSDNACLNTTWNNKVTSLRIIANGVTTLAGTYFLQNRHSGMNMDVWGASSADGANVAQSAAHTGTNQQFKLNHLGNGVYQVLAVHSNKGLDVDAGKKDNGANVQQWSYLGNNHQQYIVVATDLAGCYKLIAKHSGKVVEVAGASTAGGANVQQWDNNNQTCGQWKFIPVTPVVDGTGDGLTGNYFNGMNFETPVFSRKDVVINADWGGGSPNAAVNADLFSARWTGQIQPRHSGEYTFYINSDNGRKLWINNTLVIDGWIDDWGTDYTGKITLTANQKYDIKLEYFENVGGANIKFEWSSAAQQREVVPTTQLYSNPLPSVSISAPTANATFSAPASVTITANASDNIGIAKVEFYNGANKLGEDNTAPYSFNWTNVSAGSYNLTTRATDNQGGVTVSAAVSISVTGVIGENQAPVISLTAPTNNQTYNAPASVTISANASDVDGTVSKVEFYNGTTKIGDDASAPYSFVWANVAAGTYTISAKATDDKGASTTSSSVSITVKAVVVNKPPTISLTAPTSGASFNAPASITISANATDSDGSITKVEFYNGATKVGEDASTPYSFVWSNVAAGTYTISAKAIDNSAASTTSSSVSITVKTVVTDACANVAAYAENNGYVAGSVVKSGGRRYECKEWPYSGWCNGASWAYGPGSGAYWADAWYDRGSCSSARVANDATTLASTVIVSPNPTEDNVQIQVPANGSVSVFNSKGEQVLASREIVSEESISLGHLPSGMYMIKLEIGNEIVTKVVVKQ